MALPRRAQAAVQKSATSTAIKQKIVALIKMLEKTLLDVPNDPVGIELDQMPQGNAMGPNAIPDPHLQKTIGSSFQATDQLWPMTAADGPNIRTDGPGQPGGNPSSPIPVKPRQG